VKRLVLFDIDGTLIHGGRLWAESFYRAISVCWPGAPLPTKPSFAGKTDPQIFREILAMTGLPTVEIEAGLPKVMSTYLEIAREQLPTRKHEIEVLSGVNALLECVVAHPDIVPGLLTGNLQEGARLKLGAVGLAKYFDFGIFADDHHDRYELPAIGVTKALARFGREFRGKDVVIIGDTIHDVRCGRSIGVRTIAVGTGWRISREELLAENPDYFFADLTDTDAVLDAILKDL